MFVTFALPAYIVCIDPGHLSEVGRGTRGRKLTEIKAVWQVAQLLKKELVSDGVKVIFTKNAEQEFVTNRRRAEIANSAHSDLMVRLHCDAANGSGFTAYFPDRQGVSHGFKGPSLSLLHIEKPAAEEFHRVLAENLKGILTDNGLKGDEFTAVGRVQGALNGSIYSKVPVVLVEMVVLTNPKDEAIIASKTGQEKISRALGLATMATLKKLRVKQD